MTRVKVTRFLCITLALLVFLLLGDLALKKVARHEVQAHKKHK